MYTSYEEIYEDFLPKTRNYDFLAMSEEELKEHLHDYLVPAIARFHVCRKDLNDRDDLLQRFNSELSDLEIEILSNFCLLEHIDSTYVRTQNLLKMNLASTDFNSFSSANHLDKLMEMRNKYLKENEGLLIRYAWKGAMENGVSWSAGYNKRSANSGASTMW